MRVCNGKPVKVEIAREDHESEHALAAILPRVASWLVPGVAAVYFGGRGNLYAMMPPQEGDFATSEFRIGRQGKMPLHASTRIAPDVRGLLCKCAQSGIRFDLYDEGMAMMSIVLSLGEELQQGVNLVVMVTDHALFYGLLGSGDLLAFGRDSFSLVGGKEDTFPLGPMAEEFQREIEQVTGVKVEEITRLCYFDLRPGYGREEAEDFARETFTGVFNSAVFVAHALEEFVGQMGIDPWMDLLPSDPAPHFPLPLFAYLPGVGGKAQ